MAAGPGITRTLMVRLDYDYELREDGTPSDRSVLHVMLPAVHLAAMAHSLSYALKERERLARNNRTGAVLTDDECWARVEVVAGVLRQIVDGAAEHVHERTVRAAQAEAGACQDPDCPVHHPSTAGVTAN